MTFTTLGMHHAVPGMTEGKHMKTGLAGSACIKQGLLTEPNLTALLNACVTGNSFTL